jgi:plastocyanin
MTPGRPQIAATLIAVGALAIAAPATATDKLTVKIAGHNDATYAFSPDKVHVDKGATVHWSWDSNAPHNVTFNGLGEASDTGNSGSYKLRFKQAGTFRYVCSVHGFKGKVIVG